MRRPVLRLRRLENRDIPATITWVGATSLVWGTASNWSPAQVPGSKDAAIISAAGATITGVGGTIGSITSVRTIQVDTALTLGGQGPSNFPAIINANLTANGVIAIGVGSTSKSTITINSGGNGSSIAGLTSTGRITVSGDLTASNLTQGASTITVNSGKTLTLVGTYTHNIDTWAGSGTISLAGTVAGSKTLTIPSTLIVKLAGTTVGTAVTVNGTLNADDLKANALNGSTTVAAAGKVSFAGVGGTKALSIGGAFTNNGTFDLPAPAGSAQVVAVTGAGKFTNGTTGSFNVQGFPAATFQGDLTNKGTLNVAVGAGFVVTQSVTNSGTVNLGSVSAMNVFQTFTQTAGTTSVGNSALLDPDSGLVLQGGTLEGAGTIGAEISGNGTTSPGAATAVLTSGSYSPGTSGALTVDLNGPTVGSEYDRLAVGGTVSLSGAKLNATLSYTPPPGESFVIVGNDGNEPVTGTFNGLAQGAKVTLNGVQLTVDYKGGDGNDVVLYRPYVTPVIVSAVQIDDGGVQRSMVRSVSVVFNGKVNLPATPANAFTLIGPGGPIAVTVTTSGATQTTAKLTFSGSGVTNTSLNDGLYALTVLSAQITDQFGQGIDGDNNGVAGGNASTNFHRLFGDADGDRDVDANNFGSFRTNFGSAGFIFDHDADGDVDSQDFGQFRLRFGTSV